MRIEGRNPVLEAFRAGVGVTRVLVAEGAGERGTFSEILRAAEARGVPVERMPRPDLDRLAETRAHQGVVAEAPDFEYRPWAGAVAAAQTRGEVPLLLALDGITDPQNTGSLIRSAVVFGAHGVLLPLRRAAGVTAAVLKASAGAAFSIPVDQVINLERALDACRKAGLWVAGLDADAKTQVSDCPLLSEPLVLVVGAEGKGLSRLLRERADVLIAIPQRASFDSLGAAVSGAIALYEVSRTRSGPPGGT